MEIFKSKMGTEGIRRDKLNGRDYLVAPVTMIVPGVLSGSKGSLLYTLEEISRDPSIWNGMPIVNGHPNSGSGGTISARNPEVLEKQQIGTIFKAAISSGKLVAEGWFDLAATQRIEPAIIQHLLSRRSIEVSTGVFTGIELQQGTHNGIPYEGIARELRADHLAILIDQQGACSCRDGCGVLANEGLRMPNFLEPPDPQQSWAAMNSFSNFIDELLDNYPPEEVEQESILDPHPWEGSLADLRDIPEDEDDSSEILDPHLYL